MGRNLARENVPFRLTMSMSPPLVSMLRDDHLKIRTAAYLDRLKARPSYARVLKEAEPYFAMFPR